jgi:hypothetical protein
VREARKSGAAGYIIKQDATKQLIPAIRAASNNQLSI